MSDTVRHMHMKMQHNSWKVTCSFLHLLAHNKVLLLVRYDALLIYSNNIIITLTF